jgi:3-oxoisoapionate decarboxylase
MLHARRHPFAIINAMYRRAFLQSLPAAAALEAATQTPAFATAAQQTPGNAVPIKLGFDSYSLRAFKWKAPQLVDYAGSLKLDTIQISSLDEYESKEPAYLQKIKDQAARYNMVLDAGMGCICPSSHSFSKNGPPARDRMLEGLRIARGWRQGYALRPGVERRPHRPAAH